MDDKTGVALNAMVGAYGLKDSQDTSRRMRGDGARRPCFFIDGS